MDMKSILIVDDEPSMRAALAESLASCGYHVETADDGGDALESFEQTAFDAVVTDMRMPKIGGMELLRGIKDRSPETPVIVITAYGTVNTAVEAMKEGAADFLMKPFSLDRLEDVLRGVITREPPCEGSAKDVADKTFRSTIISRDPAMLSLLGIMEKAAPGKASVLIEGESGTGKEMFARHIHRHSKRAAMPFVAVNCAAIPENLLESEMFGYEKGAFTGAAMRKTGKFEQADGGTILLDEIGEMAAKLQAKLLRVIQESEVDRLGGRAPVPVDARIIATTNKDLKEEVSKGTFREDLYYRLNVVPIKIPPLRERKADIPILCDCFMKKYSKLNGIGTPEIPESVMEVLLGHDWPGNVRELENIIERALLFCGGEIIALEHLLWGKNISEQPCRRPSCSADDAYATGSADCLTLRECEKRVIYNALDSVGWNKTRASQILGVSVRTIRNKLNEYKVEKSAARE